MAWTATGTLAAGPAPQHPELVEDLGRPIGLPAGWPILVDAAVVAAGEIVIGGGVRGSKLFLPGTALLALPGAELVEGLGRPIG